jgi:hypothetical protein|nr:MAG TPA: hypothetical protein [Caudoviricetes sp.]
MILERQIELLLCCKILDAIDLNQSKVELVELGYVDLDALRERTRELISEFLKPYVIDNTPKGD